MAEMETARAAAPAGGYRKVRNPARGRAQSGLPLHSARVLASIAVLSATTVSAEIYLPAGVWAAALHLSLVFLGVWLASPRDVYVLAAIASGLTALGAVLTAGAGSVLGQIHTLVSGPGLANRLILILAIWALAAVLAESKRREARLRARMLKEAAQRQAAVAALENSHSLPRPSALDVRVRDRHDMGHEIRTLLNAIVGFSEAAKSEIFGPIEDRRYREYLGHINTSGWALLRVFESYLAAEPPADMKTEEGARRAQGSSDSPADEAPSEPAEETPPEPLGETPPASAVK